MEENTYEINIFELLGILKKNWLKLVIAALIGAVLALTYTVLLVTPQYQSTAKMVIINKQQINITSSDIQASAQLTNDCVEALGSRDLMNEVVQDLDWDVDAATLLAETSVTVPTDTRVLCVTVTDPNPEHARKIAYKIYEKASEIFVDTLDINAVNLIEEPIKAKSPSSPSKSKNTAIGALLGIMIVAGILLIRHLTDNKVRTAEDIENVLNLTLLAAIPADAEESQKQKKKQKKERSDVLRSVSKR